VMRQVALWGLPEDEAIDATRRELTERGTPHFLINQADVHQLHFDLDTARGVSGELHLGTQRVELSEIGAVLARPGDIRAILRNVAGTQDPQAAGTLDPQLYRQAVALERQLFVWIDIAPMLVLNRPSAAASNGSKPWQTELLRGRGLVVPPTLVTTSPEAVWEFIREHGQVIYKSVSGHRSIVSRVNAPHFDQIEDVANCPTQFQAYIRGTDWRAHVVGNEVYACEIRCEADDYRMAGARGEAIEFRPGELPEAVAKCCLDLALQLDLPLAGIDLRRTDAGEWYWLEVNPTPAFTYFEQETGQPLTAAVAQLLIAACASDARTSRATL
jgi:glutathione synthase/RimK-type ligase-like ATP-grasp enzyme